MLVKGATEHYFIEIWQTSTDMDEKLHPQKIFVHAVIPVTPFTNMI